MFGINIIDIDNQRIYGGDPFSTTTPIQKSKKNKKTENTPKFAFCCNASRKPLFLLRLGCNARVQRCCTPPATLATQKINIIPPIGIEISATVLKNPANVEGARRCSTVAASVAG